MAASFLPKDIWVMLINQYCEVSALKVLTLVSKQLSHLAVNRYRQWRGARLNLSQLLQGKTCEKFSQDHCWADILELPNTNLLCCRDDGVQIRRVDGKFVDYLEPPQLSSCTFCVDQRKSIFYCVSPYAALTQWNADTAKYIRAYNHLRGFAMVALRSMFVLIRFKPNDHEYDSDSDAPSLTIDMADSVTLIPRMADFQMMHSHTIPLSRYTHTTAGGKLAALGALPEQDDQFLLLDSSLQVIRCGADGEPLQRVYLIPPVPKFRPRQCLRVDPAGLLWLTGRDQQPIYVMHPRSGRLLATVRLKHSVTCFCLPSKGTLVACDGWNLYVYS